MFYWISDRLSKKTWQVLFLLLEIFNLLRLKSNSFRYSKKWILGRFNNEKAITCLLGSLRMLVSSDSPVFDDYVDSSISAEEITKACCQAAKIWMTLWPMKMPALNSQGSCPMMKRGLFSSRRYAHQAGSLSKLAPLAVENFLALTLRKAITASPSPCHRWLYGPRLQV